MTHSSLASPEPPASESSLGDMDRFKMLHGKRK